MLFFLFKAVRGKKRLTVSKKNNTEASQKHGATEGALLVYLH